MLIEPRQHYVSSRSPFSGRCAKHSGKEAWWRTVEKFSFRSAGFFAIGCGMSKQSRYRLVKICTCLHRRAESSAIETRYYRRRRSGNIPAPIQCKRPASVPSDAGLLTSRRCAISTAAAVTVPVAIAMMSTVVPVAPFTVNAEPEFQRRAAIDRRSISRRHSINIRAIRSVRIRAVCRVCRVCRISGIACVVRNHRASGQQGHEK